MAESIRDDYILEARDIVKEFSGVRVLDNVDFCLKRGEVHALLGENGAGKSTLVKIMTGAYQMTSGSLSVNGEEVHFNSTHDAGQKGIGIIFQEFSQVPQLSVTENLFLGGKPKKKLLGGLIQLVNWRQMRKLAKKALEDLNLDINPDVQIDSIGVAHQQLIEIAKALMVNANILIMDEPTAALSAADSDKLFEIINELKNKGVSIIYISHRLEEISRICDRATILRNGKKLETVEMKQTSIDHIIKMMVGRELGKLFPENQDSVTNQNLLSVSNLSCKKRKFTNINFEVKAGEILGFTGLVGAGKTEVMRAIFGADQDYTGDIFVNGKKVKIASPDVAIKNGLAFVPEDRKFQGLITVLSARENILLGNYKTVKGKLKLINTKQENLTAKKYFEKLNISPFNKEKKAQFFSGGNQQKLVISRWLCSNAKLYIFDEPTRGVDVGAKAEIYKLISSLASSGCGVIVSSSEIEEVIGLSNRILVMNKGSIVAEYSHEECDYAKIMKSQAGGIKNEQQS